MSDKHVARQRLSGYWMAGGAHRPPVSTTSLRRQRLIASPMQRIAAITTEPSLKLYGSGSSLPCGGEAAAAWTSFDFTALRPLRSDTLASERIHGYSNSMAVNTSALPACQRMKVEPHTVEWRLKILLTTGYANHTIYIQYDPNVSN
jgi:hypothetical protein